MSGGKANFWARLFGVSRQRVEAGAETTAKTDAEVTAKWDAVTKAEAEAKALAIAQSEEACETSLIEVLCVVTETVQQHGPVLVAKRRQMTYRDDYGRFVDDAWKSEVEYFRSSIVEEQLIVRCGREKAVDALKAWRAKWLAARPAGEVARVEIYDLFISTYIDLEVQKLDSEAVEDIRRDGEFSPRDFEHHCADVLRAAGWTVRVCGGPGDQGVDLVADCRGLRAVFQCKLYSSPVGNGAVQEVHTGMKFHSAHLAAVVSSAGFTPSARAAAEQTGVVLLHQEQLPDFAKDRTTNLPTSPTPPTESPEL